ncbi:MULTISPECIES: MFS transporter [Streptacidiphilus]|uniref:MFS transporter n=1 Tax=Streptacidiphilus cavernicola TaxID=3342716 RepID=A0ABV6UJC9_9ACTN|nr:MFS transporter [Streptacidiphilus jeojiense]
MASESRRTHHQVTFAVLAAGVAAYALLQSLVTPVLPTIQANLHTTQSTVTWVLTAYLLSASIFTPIMGRIGDMIGKERVFVATLIALAAGSLLAALAGSVTVMIVARVIQGVGGGVLPLAFGIIRDEFPREKLNGAIGAIASLSAVGAGLGIVLAGPIVDALDYHWLFWLPMILTIAAAVAAHFLVPESPVRTPGRISWAPALLLSAWLVALLVALSEAPTWGWGSGKVIGLLVAAVVLAAGWVLVELRAATPLIDMTMMRRKAVWTNNLVALLIGVGMYAVFAFLPEFVQTPKAAGYGFGASITQSGLILLPSTVTMFAIGMAAGGLSRRIGAKAVVLLGCLVSVVPMLLLAFAHSHTWELYLATGIMGIGFGLAFAAMSGLIVAAVPPEQTGVASGMNANIRTIGGSIGAALMASIVTANAQPSGLPREAGYTHGFAMLAGAMVIAALAAVVIPASRAGRKVASALPADEPAHPELGVVAGGTLIGDKPE